MRLRIVYQTLGILFFLGLTLTLSGCAANTPQQTPTPTEHITKPIVDLTQLAPFKREGYWCDYRGPFLTDFSPDGNWVASICDHPLLSGNISVINRNGVIWRITDTQLFGRGWKIVFLPQAWSSDSQYLYFSTTYPWSNFIDPDATPPLIPWCFNPEAVSFVKLDLETGATTFLLGNANAYNENNYEPYTYAVSLSPSQKFLAYSLRDRNYAKIIIRNLENNQETSLPVDVDIEKDSAVIKITWTVDETQLDVTYIICSSKMEKQISIPIALK